MKFYKKNDSGEFEEAQVTRVFESQSDLDNFMKERVDRATEKAIEPFAGFEEIKSQLDTANKRATDLATEKSTLEETLKSKDKEVGSAKLDVSRVKIQNEFGLSDDLGKFLTGDDEAAIRANAEILKKNGGNGGSINFEKDKGDGSGPTESPNKAHVTNLFGSKS